MMNGMKRFLCAAALVLLSGIDIAGTSKAMKPAVASQPAMSKLHEVGVMGKKPFTQFERLPSDASAYAWGRDSRGKYITKEGYLIQSSNKPGGGVETGGVLIDESGNVVGNYALLWANDNPGKPVALPGPLYPAQN